MSKNPLGDLIQEYMDDPKHRYPPKAADLARETGVSEQVISKWRSKRMLPTASQLISFSRGTGIPYERLLVSALTGRLYLPPGTTVEIPEGFQEWLEEAAVSAADHLDREDAAEVVVEHLEARREAIAARRSAKHPPRATPE